ncbi:MAG TPA: hypothetical protein VGK33_00060, partial [Chloroflexota bacterium]
VATPEVEFTPEGVQLAYGPRVPLLMFGGHVRPGIDSRWCSHVSVPKTAMQLLGLPALGVPRLDNDSGLADLVDLNIANPPPPRFSSSIVLPPVPHPTPAPHPLPAPPTTKPTPVSRVVLRGGKTLPPPDDAPLPVKPAGGRSTTKLATRRATPPAAAGRRTTAATATPRRVSR